MKMRMAIVGLLSMCLILGPIAEQRGEAALPLLIFKIIKIAKVAYKLHGKACKGSSVAYKVAVAANQTKPAHRIKTGARHVLCRWALK